MRLINSYPSIRVSINRIARYATSGYGLLGLAAAAITAAILFLILLFAVWLTWESNEVGIFSRNRLVVNLFVITMVIAGTGAVFLVAGLRWRGLTREVASQKQLNNVLREMASSASNSEKAQIETPTELELPDGLTVREVEIMALIAAGKTDREIGIELFISPKTVGNHLSNIRNKINAGNRTEVAAYAIRHNLA